MLNNPPKAKILKIGTVPVSENGKTILSGWEFDCKGEVPGIDATGTDVRLAGYTINELKKIAEEHNL